MIKVVDKNMAATVAAAFARRCFGFQNAKALSYKNIHDECMALLRLRQRNQGDIWVKLVPTLDFIKYMGSIIAPDWLYVEGSDHFIYVANKDLLNLIADHEVINGYHKMIDINETYVKEIAIKTWEYIMSYELL